MVAIHGQPGVTEHKYSHLNNPVHACAVWPPSFWENSGIGLQRVFIRW